MNSLCYGNSGDDWCKEHNLIDLPPILAALKSEVRAVIMFMWAHAPDQIKTLLAQRERPQLTLMSAMCQLTERPEVEELGIQLPPDVQVRGYLGDSILAFSDEDWDVEAYIQNLEAVHDIIASEKKFPATIQEYLDWYQSHTGKGLDITPLSGYHRNKTN